MNFFAAIKRCFGHYATFSGRARRSEYWNWVLFCVIIGVLIGWIPIIGMLVMLALVIPSFAVGVRRLHDTGKSGWWILLSLLPLVNLVLLYSFIIDSTPGENEYGSNPKA